MIENVEARKGFSVPQSAIKVVRLLTSKYSGVFCLKALSYFIDHLAGNIKTSLHPTIISKYFVAGVLGTAYLKVPNILTVWALGDDRVTQWLGF